MAKVNKNFSNFFSKAAAAGYGSNQVIQFLQGLYSNPVAEGEKERLNAGMSKGTLRPDEQESLQEIERSQTPAEIAKGAGNLAFSLGGAGLAVTKGPAILKKASGAIGKFFGKEEVAKKTVKGVKNAAKAASSSAAPVAEVATATQAPQAANALQSFVSQYPQLGKALNKHVQAGMGMKDAAIQVKKNKMYSPITKKIESDMGQPFEDLVGQLFGGSEGESQGSAGDLTSNLIQSIDRLGKILGG